MKYIETWIGDHLIDDPLSIEQHAVKEGEWFILPDKLPPPIKTKLVLSEDDIDRVIIDYLEFRVTDISHKENKITISNYHQKNSPVILSLIIPSILSKDNKLQGSSKFNIKIRESFKGKVIAEKTFLEFMKYTEQSSEISLIEIERQKEFFTSKGIKVNNPQESEYMDGRLAILSDLLKIEKEFDIYFDLPEKMNEENFNNIEMMLAIIQGKEIVTKIDGFSVVFNNKDALKKLVYDVKDKPIMLTGHEYKAIELFGVKFENIKVSYSFENLVVKNPDRIRNKLKFLDEGENTKVEFIPGTKDLLKTRYKIEK